MTQTSPPRPHPNGLLFLCDGISSCSQMAEGFARFIGPSDLLYFSAGLAAAPLNPQALKAMREVGVDIADYQAHRLADVDLSTVATIVTLCEEEDCPELPAGIHHLAWPLPNPARARGDEEEILQTFRRTRDQIRELVSRLF